MLCNFKRLFIKIMRSFISIQLYLILCLLVKDVGTIQWFDEKMQKKFGDFSFSFKRPADTTRPGPTIDSLEVGKLYEISVKSNGCFHHSTLDLEIKRQSDGYFATFKMKGKVEGQKVHAKYKPVKLNDIQIDSIRTFEKTVGVDLCYKERLYNGGRLHYYCR